MNICDIFSTDNVPVSLKIGGRKLSGLSEFNPEVVSTTDTAGAVKTLIKGRIAEGLEITCEIALYKNYKAGEYLCCLENKGEENTPVLSELYSFDGIIPLKNANSGDFELSGSPFEKTEPKVDFESDDTELSCYIGWTGSWRAAIETEGEGVKLQIGQKRTNMYLARGEKIMLPRVTFLMCDKFDAVDCAGKSRFLNCEILKENICLDQDIEKKIRDTFTDGDGNYIVPTEKNQLEALGNVLKNDSFREVWYIGKGWYYCEKELSEAGNWFINPDNWPKGMGPVGKLCEANNKKLMLYFEPERVSKGSWMYDHHMDWQLALNPEKFDESPERMMYFGNPDCVKWWIDLISATMEDAHGGVLSYAMTKSQNVYFVANETEERIGFMENQHVQGLYRLWEGLYERNPEMIICDDFTAGRGNDLELKRRISPLVYKGHHEI